MPQPFARPDKNFIVLILFVVLVLGFSSIVAPSLTPQWYQIDAILTGLITTFILFSRLPDNVTMAWQARTAITQFELYGKMNRLPLQTRYAEGSIARLRVTMGITFIIAIPMALAVVSKAFGVDLSIVLPIFTTAAVSGTLASVFSSDFIVAFIQPILEETLRAGILDKTIAGWVTSYLGFGISLILIGAMVMFLLFNIAGYLGLIAIILGVAVIYFTKDKKQKNATPTALARQIGIIAAAVFLAGLHGYVLSTNTSVGFQTEILTLTVFFIILSEIDLVLDSVVPSIMLHSIFNAIQLAQRNIEYIITGLFVNGLLDFIIYKLFSVGSKGS